MLSKIFAYYKTNRSTSFILLGIVCFLFMVTEIYHDRFKYHDFEVYYKAGGRILAGENLYRPVEDGFYRYLYTPTAAIYFIPFALLPFPVAKVVYWCFLTAMILLGFYLALSLVSPDFRKDAPTKTNTLLLLAGLILGVHIQYELHLGQVNHVLLVMYLCIVYVFVKHKPVVLALIWAVSIFIKSFGLIFVPYFIVKKRLKELGLFLLFGVLLFFSPLVFYDRTAFVNQLRGSIREIRIELAEKQDLLRPENHTIFSVVVRYSPLRFVKWTPFSQAIYQGLLMTLMALGVLWIIKKGRSLSNSYVLEFAMLTGLVPLIAFSNYNAFGFVELIVFLLLFNFHDFSAFEKTCAVAGFLLTGGNWYDLWGKRLWNVFQDTSCVAIGTILLMIVCCFRRAQEKL